ncbi:MAG: phosphotransferase [Steroidobacteraceae bacterium]
MAMTIEQLTAAYEEEQRNQRPPLSIDDVPLTYEAITPEWLTAVLCREHPDARVLHHQLDVPDDGNSNRRRIFIEYNAAGQTARLPERVFCKASQGLANRISLGPAGAIEAEVHFYNRIRPLLDIETPIALFAQFNWALNSIVILRELHPATVFCSHTTQINRARAESQLRLLAKLHGRFMQPSDAALLSPFRSWSAFFAQLDYPAYVRACERGFEIAADVVPPRLFARRNEIWPATRKSVARQDQLPFTLAHGDVHLRNWYIAHDGGMGVTDWQAATRGHWSRDVAYALATSLPVGQRRAWENDLMRLYLDELQHSSGQTLDFDELFLNCRQQLMSALAFWTITMNPAPGMPDMQPRDATLEFIRRIAAAIDDLDSLDSF